MLASIFLLSSLTGYATDMFVDYVAKRLAGAVIDEVSDRTSGAFGNLGQFFSQKLVAATGSPSSATPEPNPGPLEDRIRTAVDEAMQHVGVSVVTTAELSALLKIAQAADGEGDLKEALSAWKKIAAERSQA